MDFALKPNINEDRIPVPVGFNPCFDGFCSKTKLQPRKKRKQFRFNPCFDGFCSKTRYIRKKGKRSMEVSILVLMDFALKLNTDYPEKFIEDCFNPCFDGFCSKTGGGNPY